MRGRPVDPSVLGFTRLRLLASYGDARAIASGREFQREPIEKIRDEIRQFAWQPLVATCARLNGFVLSHPDGTAVHDAELRAGFRANHRTSEEWLVRYLAEHPNYVLANEAALTFVSGLAILDGDGAHEITAADLARLLLLANDYALEFRVPRSRANRGRRQILSDNLVAGARAQLFNRHPDTARELVRLPLLLARYDALPSDLKTIENLDDLQHSAFFGLSADDYVAALVAPLVMTASAWGSSGFEQSAVMDPLRVFSSTQLPKDLLLTFYDSLTLTRDQAAAEIRATIRDDLPVPRMTFARHHPFVRLDDNLRACISPAFLLAQLRTGMLMRLADAEERRKGRGGYRRLMTVVGHLLESWAHELMAEAAETNARVAEWMLPREERTRELCDMVLRTGGRAILFEIKCASVHEPLLNLHFAPLQTARSGSLGVMRSERRMVA